MHDPEKDLSRRERQIMQVVFAKGKATAKDVVAEIPDPPSRTAVRTLLSILVDKGVLVYERNGREFVYSPSKPREVAGRGALQNVLKTFFGGSIENLIASHFSDPDAEIGKEEIARISKMLRDAKKQAADSKPKPKNRKRGRGGKS